MYIYIFVLWEKWHCKDIYHLFYNAYSKFMTNILSGDEILTIRYRCCLSSTMPCTCTCCSKKIYSTFRFVTNSAYREATLSAMRSRVIVAFKFRRSGCYTHPVVTSCLLYDKYSVIWHLYMNDWNARFLYTNVRLPYLRCASVCVLLNMNFRQ